MADEQTTGALDYDAVALITDAIQNEGYTFGDFADIDEKDLEGTYAAAYNLINQNHYADAEELLKLLCYLSHHDSRFWLALGVARQMQKKYEAALNAYSSAALHDLDNPVPPLRAAECFLALGNAEKAAQALEGALYACEENPGHDDVQQRATLLLEGLQQSTGE